MFTAIAPGTTTVTATSGTVSGSTTITVTGAVLTSLAVSPVSPQLSKGATQAMTAQGFDQFNQPFATTVTWTSSATSIGTINPSTGLFTAVAAGTTTLTATSGSVTGATTVTVTPAAPVLTSIIVTPQTSTVQIGGTIVFSAQGLDQNSAPFSATFTWTSSAPSVGTIDAATGAFAAVAPGTTTITAKSGTVTGTATVNVTPSHNTNLKRLRVVGWNVAQGYTVFRQFDHQSQIDLIASMSPDIVVLSEMSLADNDMVSEFLAGMVSRTGKAWAGHFSPGIPGAAPANSIGDMIMTWLPVDSQTTLPYCVIPGDTALPNDSSCVTFEHLRVTINNVPVDVASAHLNWFSNANRVAQLQQLQSWMAGYGPNQMLIGDFNAEPTDTAFWAPLKTSFRDVWASVVGTTGDLGITKDQRTVTNAPGRIDYHFIPLNTTHIGVQQFSVVKTVLSDHHLLFGDYIIMP